MRTRRETARGDAGGHLLASQWPARDGQVHRGDGQEHREPHISPKTRYIFIEIQRFPKIFKPAQTPRTPPDQFRTSLLPPAIPFRHRFAFPGPRIEYNNLVLNRGAGALWEGGADGWARGGW